MAGDSSTSNTATNKRAAPPSPTSQPSSKRYNLRSNLHPTSEMPPEASGEISDPAPPPEIPSDPPISPATAPPWRKGGSPPTFDNDYAREKGRISQVVDNDSQALQQARTNMHGDVFPIDNAVSLRAQHQAAYGTRRVFVKIGEGERLSMLQTENLTEQQAKFKEW